MICSSTSGTTISSSERPNIDCGNSRLIKLRPAPAPSGIASLVGSDAAKIGGDATAASVGLEDIADPSHRLQIARITRILLDLASQPRHLHIDVAHIAAELRRLRQVFARDRLPGTRRQQRQQACLGSGQVHDVVAAKKFPANRIETESTKAQTRFFLEEGRGST